MTVAASPLATTDVTVLDLVDRLLDKGVAISGDVVLSVAGVDLVYLGLRAVLLGIDGDVG